MDAHGIGIYIEWEFEVTRSLSSHVPVQCSLSRMVCNKPRDCGNPYSSTDKIKILLWQPVGLKGDYAIDIT